MRNVYVCSPLRGNITENLEKVKQYGKFVLECGMAPVIPHFYAEILDDTVDEERALGMTAGTSLLFRADALWVFGDKITEGMKKEISYAKHLKLESSAYVAEFESVFVCRFCDGHHRSGTRAETVSGVFLN